MLTHTVLHSTQTSQNYCVSMWMTLMLFLKELCKVDKWLQANKLTLNIRKTDYMLFHRVRLKGSNLISILGEKQFSGLIVPNFRSNN